MNGFFRPNPNPVAFELSSKAPVALPTQPRGRSIDRLIGSRPPVEVRRADAKLDRLPFADSSVGERGGVVACLLTYLRTRHTHTHTMPATPTATTTSSAGPIDAPLNQSIDGLAGPSLPRLPTHPTSTSHKQASKQASRQAWRPGKCGAAARGSTRLRPEEAAAAAASPPPVRAAGASRRRGGSGSDISRCVVGGLVGWCRGPVCLSAWRVLTGARHACMHPRMHISIKSTKGGRGEQGRVGGCPKEGLHALGQQPPEAEGLRRDRRPGHGHERRWVRACVYALVG